MNGVWFSSFCRFPSYLSSVMDWWLVEFDKGLGCSLYVRAARLREWLALLFVQLFFFAFCAGFGSVEVLSGGVCGSWRWWAAGSASLVFPMAARLVETGVLLAYVCGFWPKFLRVDGSWWSDGYLVFFFKLTV